LEYPIDDEEPFRHIEAWEVKNIPTIAVGNEDEYVSEMFAKTKGVNSTHDVTNQAHKVEYSIVLYNGSTDTLRNIKMLDTLDLKYFQLKTTAYTGTNANKAGDFTLSGANLVQVDFKENVLLPDKFLVCAFSVSLKDSIANKTKIENKAYFTFEKGSKAKFSPSGYFHTINDTLFKATPPPLTTQLANVPSDKANLINAVIYPNPFSDKAILLIANENNIPLSKVKIYNVAGICLETIPIKGEKIIEIDRENLNNGFYFLTIFDEKGRGLITRKFVVE
jgi:hypothetical protein